MGIVNAYPHCGPNWLNPTQNNTKSLFTDRHVSSLDFDYYKKKNLNILLLPH